MTQQSLSDFWRGDMGVKALPETHQQGLVTLENVPQEGFPFRGDFGIMIAKDGRVWICLNGVAFIRFSPHLDGKMSREP